MMVKKKQGKQTGRYEPAYITWITCGVCKKRTDQLTTGKKGEIRFCLEHGGAS